MGCFAWLFANNGKPLCMGSAAYVYCPNGDIITERDYEGYGKFGGCDIYNLVADWNRKFLSEHPEFLIPQHGQILQPDGSYKTAAPRRVDSYDWYEFYKDLSLTPDEIVDKLNESKSQSWKREYRSIGIDIACYDDRNAWLPYPIKIASRGDIEGGYNVLPPSNGDPNQGMGPVPKKLADNFQPSELKKGWKYTCPKCGQHDFRAEAHVTQTWRLDGNGVFAGEESSMDEVLRYPSETDMWECQNCHYQAVGAEFVVSSSSPKITARFVLRIFERNVPYIPELTKLKCNDGKVAYWFQNNNLWMLGSYLTDKRYAGHAYSVMDTEEAICITTGVCGE